MESDQSFFRWTLTSQSTCGHVCFCDCSPSVWPVKSPFLSLPSYSDPHPQRSTLRALRPRGLCVSVCIYECQYMQENTQKKFTPTFSWPHQWIVNTVLTIAGWPLATTYWIRYVTSDMASIWNPFVMQYRSVLHVEVKTQRWVIERS